MSDVSMIVGFPAAGKSSLADEYRKKNYVILNRDSAGGKVIDLVAQMHSILSNGDNVLLDNTFPTIESRKPFIECANEFNTKITCDWITTSIEDAQFNACMRMMDKVGKIMTPEEMKASKSPNLFPPVVLFKYKKEFQKPTTDEGFGVIIKREFNRSFPKEWTNKAVLLDYDGTLRDTISGAKWPQDPKDVITLPNREEVLKSYAAQGYMLLGVSNQSGIAKGTPDEAGAIACFERTNELLDLDIEVSYCPHRVPPINCYCRKPMPGMAVELFHKYKLDPRKCIMVGDMTSDKTFAQRSHIGQYIDAEEFFAKKENNV